MGMPGFIKRLALSRVTSALALLVLLCLGCGNPFTQFYTGKTLAQVQNANLSVGSPADKPTVLTVATQSFDTTLRDWKDAGWVVVGRASWVGSNTGSVDQATEQARRVGASLVIWTYEYRGSSTGAVPITTPTTSTTYGSGTVYSPGSVATWTGSATTYGTQTSFVPITVHYYSVRSVFLSRSAQQADTRTLADREQSANEMRSRVAMAESTLGLEVTHLRPTDQNRSGTSLGALIKSVASKGLAADAGLKPGDVIVRIGYVPVVGEVTYGTAVQQSLGKAVELECYRDGSVITTLVSFPGNDLSQPDNPPDPILGAVVTWMQPSDKDRSGTMRGAVIRSMTSDSPAAVAGLQTGDVIVRIGDSWVGGMSTYNSAMQDNLGRLVEFEVYRNGSVVTSKVQLKGTDRSLTP